MSVTNLLAFKREVEERERQLQRARRMKFLGSACHTAWFVTHHRCDKCHVEIGGGMTYVRAVYATSDGIKVTRAHWPQCPGDDWQKSETERIRKEADRMSPKAA